jgi:hypothetical protein
MIQMQTHKFFYLGLGRSEAKSPMSCMILLIKKQVLQMVGSTSTLSGILGQGMELQGFFPLIALPFNLWDPYPCLYSPIGWSLFARGGCPLRTQPPMNLTPFRSWTDKGLEPRLPSLVFDGRYDKSPPCPTTTNHWCFGHELSTGCPRFSTCISADVTALGPDIIVRFIGLSAVGGARDIICSSFSRFLLSSLLTDTSSLSANTAFPKPQMRLHVANLAC